MQKSGQVILLDVRLLSRSSDMKVASFLVVEHRKVIHIREDEEYQREWQRANLGDTVQLRIHSELANKLGVFNAPTSIRSTPGKSIEG